MLGDSTALTLGVALQATEPVGTQLVDAALWGCGLSIAHVSGLVRVAACNQATPRSGQWPALDAAAVASTRPGDQVLFLAGPWETSAETFVSGRTGTMAQPSYRRYEAHQLDTLYRVTTAHGAHLDLLTMAATDGNYQFGTRLSPADSPRWRADYNGLLVALARAHPRRVSVIPYGRIVSPAGKFQLTVGGVQVRTLDGFHTPSYVPGNPFRGDIDSAVVADRFYDWIGPRLWPLIVHPPRQTGQ